MSGPIDPSSSLHFCESATVRSRRHLELVDEEARPSRHAPLQIAPRSLLACGAPGGVPPGYTHIPCACHALSFPQLDPLR